MVGGGGPVVFLLSGSIAETRAFFPVSNDVGFFFFWKYKYFTEGSGGLWEYN